MKACTSSASTWYSVIPGRATCIARRWAAAVTSAARRIRRSSPALLMRRISCTSWSRATNSPGTLTPARARLRTRLTQPITCWSTSGYTPIA